MAEPEPGKEGAWSEADEARLRDIFAGPPSEVLADQQDLLLYRMAYVPEPEHSETGRDNHSDPCEGIPGYFYNGRHNHGYNR